MAHLVRARRMPLRHRRAMSRLRRWDELLTRIPADRPFEMVEVGVWKGDTARRLVVARPLLRLALVDLWSPATPESSWIRSGAKDALTPQARFDQMYDEVRRIMEPYESRVRILRRWSGEAAEYIADASQDLVFIDADHSYEGVRADMARWAPKVVPGGWLSGHDYGSPRFPGVQQAVDEAYPGRVVRGANSTWFVRF